MKKVSTIAIVICLLMCQVSFAQVFSSPFGALTVAPRVTAIASSATPTPNCDTTDLYKITALAADATFGAPTGTPADGQGLTIRIKDDGTPRALAFNSGAGGYKASADVPLPTTTVISETMILSFTYDSVQSKWLFTGFIGGL